MMKVGDRVKMILDKERSPDNRWHGETGTVARMMIDGAGEVSGNPLDGLLIEVELDSGEVPDVHFRWDDVVLLEEHEADLGIAGKQ